METAKLFKNGKSQAVRLPKAFRIKGDDVYVTKIGDAVVLIPHHKKWDSFLDSLDKFSDDFMSERSQPELEDREELFL
ncbi:MAG: virulence factor [Stygiobacter sp. RIFOXYC12_FULL_38_8]|nr:MAG: virulence factor [Stygiobacter sp. GWC2_38_9]OGU82965.1 MAG: virulence factor [Stygiobacter sp. RIFOXYA12_FULL_38_9]OGV08086.1 MAG: virulence factor [Stygiobacter sp. RIFOXYB2_FULL_37_11]OGV15602.1 MAG: virulence factor [Stygiobacter sp. RIFOXYC2_FULL_38_25]OGV16434.1 MAG: virulence factor [Stygiobacter sp. RIFOXYA2_FULL_38_8]OGV22763.1 MAG: virulence factor [Stygiobacter sp. RIFOXYC12_FULL_38_8]OGV80716.1 MAG: virulence factor [Stygiobacter sp. GWF2_38_21]RJQ62017.1 MAG: antitoxin [